MSKTKTLNQPKKQFPPVLKGFLIPVLFSALSSLFFIIAALPALFHLFAEHALSKVFYAIWEQGNILQAVLSALDSIMENWHAYLLCGAFEIWYRIDSIVILSLVLSLIALIVIFARKGTMLSEKLLPVRNPYKSFFSSALLGLGIGGIVLFLQLLTLILSRLLLETDLFSIFNLRTILYELASGAMASDDPNKYLFFGLHSLYISNDSFNTPSMLELITISFLRSLVIPCVFCLGCTGNFKKKMPVFTASLLTGIMYVLFGGNTIELLGSLLLGLLLGLVYAKTESAVSSIAFMLVSNVPTIGFYILRYCFGQEIYSQWSSFTSSLYVTYSAFRYYHLNGESAINIFLIFTAIYMAIVLLISVVLLIVGLILLLSIGRNKNKHKNEKEQLAVSDSVAVANDDPFANI